MPKKLSTPEPYAIPETRLPESARQLARFGKAVRRHVSPRTWRAISADFARVNGWAPSARAVASPR